VDVGVVAPSGGTGVGGDGEDAGVGVERVSVAGDGVGAGGGSGGEREEGEERERGGEAVDGAIYRPVKSGDESSQCKNPGGGGDFLSSLSTAEFIPPPRMAAAERVELAERVLLVRMAGAG
jgi:hypothetical protein